MLHFSVWIITLFSQYIIIFYVVYYNANAFFNTVITTEFLSTFSNSNNKVEFKLCIYIHTKIIYIISAHYNCRLIEGLIILMILHNIEKWLVSMMWKNQVKELIFFGKCNSFFSSYNNYYSFKLTMTAPNN